MKRHVQTILMALLILIPFADTLAEEETGFIALFNGQATYENQDSSDNVLGSFFLVRIFDEYDLFLGALTFASFSAVVNTSTQTSSQEQSEVNLSTVFQHRGYGPSLAYVYSTETFLGAQFWLGGTYLTNEVDIQHKIIEEVERGSGENEENFQCTGDTEEEARFRSLLSYIGIGGTVNDFGIFAQVLQHQASDITITGDSDLRCLTGTTVETRSANQEEDLNLSFQSVLVGIQYRF